MAKSEHSGEESGHENAGTSEGKKPEINLAEQDAGENNEKSNEYRVVYGLLKKQRKKIFH